MMYGLLYLIGVIPIALWGLSLAYNKKIVWWEALIGSASGIAAAGIIHLTTAALIKPMDTEAWSGQVTQAKHRPSWVEHYEEAIYRTETYTTTETYYSNGKPRTRHVTKTRRVFSHWEPRRRTHPDKWSVQTTLGNYSCDKGRYEDIVGKFGEEKAVAGTRRTMKHASRMVSGDPNDYVSVNQNGYIYPVTTTKKFENRLLKVPTVYSYEPVPPGAGVFPWPENPNKWESQRVMGTAKEAFSTLAWDQMNAKLGPAKKVNLIVIGFGSSENKGHLQEAAWKGGKKNDVVVCYGGADARNPDWVHVFGWTKEEECKVKLRDLFYEGNLSDETIPAIEGIIVSDYELFHFEDEFDHLSIAPPWWTYLICLLVVAAANGTLYFFFHTNTEDQKRDPSKESLFEEDYVDRAMAALKGTGEAPRD
jgi:hypothetical protein